MSRESIMQALFELLTASGPYATTGRRLKLWADCNEQPALFLRHLDDDYPPHATRMPSKTVMSCEVWLYANGAGVDGVPEIEMNGLLDGIEQALLPVPGSQQQTLGDQVQHCWIEGRVVLHPGDFDSQAIAIVPIKILVPTF